MLVLGIESSCDETAAAVVRDGREMVSSVIASQIKTHQRFGGVVPELASREHLDKIVPVVEEALTRAEVSSEEIDGIAVTVGIGRGKAGSKEGTLQKYEQRKRRQKSQYGRDVQQAASERPTG